MDNIANINAQKYVDSLPFVVDSIYLNNMQITVLPDLSRFIYLRLLDCNYNELISLPELNSTLQLLYCCNNRLDSLPKLPVNLVFLNCSGNRISILPKLPVKLHTLYCYNNILYCLPPLNKQLQILNCINNNLIRLPLIHDNLDDFHYYNNPIFDIINSYNLDVIINKVQKLYNFRRLFYMLKYKNKFRNWLWVRVREPKIQKMYSPENLNLLLDNMVDVDDEEEFQNKINSDWSCVCIIEPKIKIVYPPVIVEEKYIRPTYGW